MKKKEKRPIWKSCEYCKNTLCSSGGSFCKYNGINTSGLFRWRKWNDCTYFDYEKCCETCDKYEACPNIREARIADKRITSIRGACDLYTPSVQMDLYIRKNMEKKPNQKEI